MRPKYDIPIHRDPECFNLRYILDDSIVLMLRFGNPDMFFWAHLLDWGTFDLFLPCTVGGLFLLKEV